jgi:hypothetical protein
MTGTEPSASENGAEDIRPLLFTQRKDDQTGREKMVAGEGFEPSKA